MRAATWSAGRDSEDTRIIGLATRRGDTTRMCLERTLATILNVMVPASQGTRSGGLMPAPSAGGESDEGVG
jgi:hypothetical protein